MCVLMRRHLGPHTTDPPGLPSDLQHRLTDVFTAASDSDVREVLKEFCKVASTLRLLIATTAFGLGVDCKYIKSNKLWYSWNIGRVGPRIRESW